MFFSPSFNYFLLFPDPYNHVKEVFLRSLTSWGIDPYSFISASILSSDLSCLAEDSNRMIQVWMLLSLISIQYPRLDATGSTSMSWYVCFYAHGWSLFFVGWVCLPLFHTPRMIISNRFLSHFVPNLTFGAPVLQCLRKHTKYSILTCPLCSRGFFDCHLMVENPEKYVAPMAKAGVEQFIFHIEATGIPFPSLLICVQIRSKNSSIRSRRLTWRSVLPSSPTPPLRLWCLMSINCKCLYYSSISRDIVLMMGVEPGFSGQKFNPLCLEKVCFWILPSQYRFVPCDRNVLLSTLVLMVVSTTQRLWMLPLLVYDVHSASDPCRC